jgi:hypothetical protein
MSLTIQSDVANNDTLVAKVFNRARVLMNGLKTLFHESNSHTTARPSTLSFETSEPRPNGQFMGVTRPKIVRRRTIDVESLDPAVEVTQPLIGKIEFSVPVGATDAEMLEMRQDLIAVLDDDTLMGTLMTQNIAPDM